MATPLGSMRIDLELDSSKFASNLNASKRAVQYFQREARTLDATMRNSGQSMNLLSAKHKTLSQAVERQSDVVKRLHEDFKKLDPGSAKWEKAAIEIEREKGKLEGLRGELKRVETQMKSVEKVEAFKKPQAEIQVMEAKLGTLNTALSRNGDNMNLLKQKSDLLKTAFAKQQQVVLTLKEHLSSLKPGSPEWQEASIQVEAHKAKLLALKGELDDVQESLKRVHAENSRWGQASNILSSWSDKLKHGGNVLREMGDAMRPVSEVLQRGFSHSASKAAEFSSQMTTTRALLRDTFPEGAKGAGELETAITELSEASKRWAREYGISTSEINVGMQEIIKAGFDVNQTMGAMPAILNASRASGDDFGTVMKATTSILSQFGLITSDTSQMLTNTNRVTDSLAFVANKTKSGFSDMGLAMEYVGPVANSLNMSIEETASIIGIMSNKGIEGEKAGTALRGALSKLLKPSKQNANAFRELGFSAEEFKSGAIKLPDIIDRIRENTKNLTDEQRASLIAMAFGVEAQTGMNALVSEGADALRQLTNETKEAKGYTKQLADEMGGSAQANMAKFKASLEVLAINVGEKLLPHLIKLAEQGNKLIDWFGTLSPEVQQASVMFAGFLAVSHPLLNILGNLSTVGGGVLGMLGKLAAKKAAATTLAEIGVSAATAGTSVGNLAGSGSLLASIFSPTGLAVAGVLAVGGALGYFAVQAMEANARSQEWGTAVSKTEAEDLSRFKAKVDETNTAMVLFEAGAGKVETVKKAFDDLATSITTLVDEKLAKDIDLAKKFGFSDEVIEGIKSRAQRVTENVNSMNEQVKAIYERHNGDMNRLTTAEKELVLRNQNEMITAQLELMKFSAEEKKVLLTALNGELEELNLKQLTTAANNTTQMLTEENKTYKEKKAELKGLLEQFGNDTSKLNEQELAAYKKIKEELQNLDAEHYLKSNALKDKFLDIQRERLAKLRESGKSQQMIQYETAIITEAIAKQMGISYQEATKLLGKSLDETGEKLGVLSNQTAQASAEVTAANKVWDDLFTSTKPQESLNNMLSTAEGWNQFEIMVKNADVNPIGRTALAEMLVAGGHWQSMTLEQKKLVVDSSQAMVDIFESSELLKQWQSLTPEQKKLVAENLTNNPVLSAQEALDSVKQKEPAKIEASNQTAQEVEKANTAVNSPKQVSPVSMLGRDDTAPSVAQVNQSVNSPKQVAPVSMLGRNDTGTAVAQANTAVNSPRQNAPAAINAVNNASGPAQQAAWDLNSIPRNITSTITTFVQKIFKNEKGTDFHPGGLAMVNDQKGPLYKELITLPSGESFIPSGRNVILPLPRGAKVLPARQTRDLMYSRGIPKYAQGVGYPSNSSILKTMDRVEERYNTTLAVKEDNSKTIELLKEILRALKTRNNESSVVVNVTGDVSTDYGKLAEKVGLLLAQEIQRKTQLRGGIT